MLGLKRECESYQIEEDIDIFIGALQGVSSRMEKFLEDHDENDHFVSADIREAVLNFYFEVAPQFHIEYSHFSYSLKK
jgi:hypothetical protein